MPTVTAALVKEQGVPFAVVVVRAGAMQRHNRDETQRGMQPYFPGIPIVLMRQDSHGTPEYYGRKDIVRFLASLAIEQLPWKEYTFHG